MSRIAEIIKENEAELLKEWIDEMSATTRRTDLIADAEFRQQTAQVVRLLREIAQNGQMENFESTSWAALKDLLSQITRSRVQQGFRPSEVASFVFSFKKPLFARIRSKFVNDAKAIADETWKATVMLDNMGLYTAEVYQTSREEIIRRQQEDMLELSTPVVKLWDGILALPIIGTLDSSRTQVVMESLLQKIVETGSGVAIIDITGVPTVDTLVAQHLLKTITASRLMGADCIISGIRPQIAQTIVHLGVELEGVKTKATMADAFAVALARVGLAVKPKGSMQEGDKKPGEEKHGTNSNPQNG